MIQEVQLRLTPEEAADATKIRRAVAKKIGLDVSDLTAVRVRRRSIDARRNPVVVDIPSERMSANCLATMNFLESISKTSAIPTRLWSSEQALPDCSRLYA
jgi:hypothetical protein